MTRAPDDLWAVATYADGELLPLTFGDVAADAAGARPMLAAFGIGPGDVVLFISSLPEGGQYWPLQAAVMDLGATFVNAENNAFDVGRVEALVRALPVAVVIGIRPETIAGFVDLQHDPAAVFGRVRMLFGTPEAMPLPELAGLPLREVRRLGPTVALGCAEGRLHLDATQWAVRGAPDGSIVLECLRQRAIGRGPFPTGLRAAIHSGVCRCGLAGPGLTPAASPATGAPSPRGGQ